MERSCVWLRRLVVGNNPLPLTHTPTSISALKSPSPPTLVSLFSPQQHQRPSFSSATACSSSVPLLSINDDDPSNPFISGVAEAQSNEEKSKTLLKGMRYSELESWVQSKGFRPGQAMMLWKRLYGNNIWAHSCDELEGLNKDFMKTLCSHAEFRALSLKEIRSASDGTRKELADFVHIGGWNGD